ncbi:MAG: hypothetical protein RLZZ387_2099, partial [Chloroflexota bacterium]
MHRLVAASITAAAAVPALAYALAGRWPEALLCALVGVGWFGGQRRGLGWPGSIALLLLVLAAGYGVLSGLAAGWGLTGVVAALLAWDLDAFALRLAAGRAVDEAGLWRAHLRRLAPV